MKKYLSIPERGTILGLQTGGNLFEVPLSLKDRMAELAVIPADQTSKEASTPETEFFAKMGSPSYSDSYKVFFGGGDVF